MATGSCSPERSRTLTAKPIKVTCPGPFTLSGRLAPGSVYPDRTAVAARLAEIINDEPNSLIAWQSLPDSPISNSGSVEFTPADNGDGTEVRVTIGYGLPGGALGKAVATLFGESPDQQVNDDLRRFKQILETGQVLRSDGSPEGTAAARQMHQHPAQPATREGATA